MKVYCFDLDGTLCTNTNGKYKSAIPFEDRIKIVNDLYDEGNKIIIETARGAATKIDWTNVTETQLDEWGVNYHELRVGKKVQADFYIDDRAILADTFFTCASILRHKDD